MFRIVFWESDRRGFPVLLGLCGPNHHTKEYFHMVIWTVDREPGGGGVLEGRYGQISSETVGRMTEESRIPYSHLIRV